MKNLKSILAAAVATFAVAGAAHAVPAPASSPGPNGARTFAFTSEQIDNDGTIANEDNDFQTGNQIAIQQTTTVDVQPYFYVTGSLGGDWELNGWDANESSAKTSVLSIYHNDDFLADFNNFGNPSNGTHQLNLQIKEEYNTATGLSGVGFAKAPASGLNAFNADPTNQSQTNGFLTWTFHQYLSAPTSSPAGIYTVTPSITFTSSAN